MQKLSTELTTMKELAQSKNTKRELIDRAGICTKKALVEMLAECGIVAGKRASKKVLVNALANAVIKSAAVGNMDSRRFLNLSM